MKWNWNANQQNISLFHPPSPPQLHHNAAAAPRTTPRRGNIWKQQSGSNLGLFCAWNTRAPGVLVVQDICKLSILCILTTPGAPTINTLTINMNKPLKQHNKKQNAQQEREKKNWGYFVFPFSLSIKVDAKYFSCRARGTWHARGPSPTNSIPSMSSTTYRNPTSNIPDWTCYTTPLRIRALQYICCRNECVHLRKILGVNLSGCRPTPTTIM